jgi:hypothetical protein
MMGHSGSKLLWLIGVRISDLLLTHRRLQ